MTASRWPLGVSYTSWRYLWRTTPWKRFEEEGSWPADSPPVLADGVELVELQPVGHGAGAFFRRRYTVLIDDAEVSPRELIDLLCEDPGIAAPSEFVRFHKVLGDEGCMSVGDEYLVHMPGPWDGPVRVVGRTPTSFTLATLDGHLEAGQIRFSADDAHTGMTFTIESWARGGDRLSNFLYDRLRMSKEVQLHMWSSFLEGVVKLSGGKRRGPFEIHTRRVVDLPADA